MLTHSMGWGMWFLMIGSTLAFWAVVFFAVRVLLNVPKGEPTEPSGPVLLLQERLARGELTPEQYEQHRRLVVDGR